MSYVPYTTVTLRKEQHAVEQGTCLVFTWDESPDPFTPCECDKAPDPVTPLSYALYTTVTLRKERRCIFLVQARSKEKHPAAMCNRVPLCAVRRNVMARS